VDVSAFAVTAAYDAHLPLGASRMTAIVRAMASEIGESGVEASLRLWTPLGVMVSVLREISPATRDLRDGAVRLDDRTVEYPAGSWTDGAREYELALALPARRAGDEMLAARVGVAVAEEVVARAKIAVAWTDDERLIADPDGFAAEPTIAAGELPTGLSPRPRHTFVGEPAGGEPCPECGLFPADGDRFCDGLRSAARRRPVALI
jgi:hypothetical protein